MKRRYLLLPALVLVVMLAACTKAPSHVDSSTAAQDALDKAQSIMPNASNEDETLDDWVGEYVDGSRTLMIEQTDQSTIEYIFSSGVEGTARISGSTAKDDTYLFSLSGNTITVAGGDESGNYTK